MDGLRGLAKSCAEECPFAAASTNKCPSEVHCCSPPGDHGIPTTLPHIADGFFADAVWDYQSGGDCKDRVQGYRRVVQERWVIQGIVKNATNKKPASDARRHIVT
eukprot:TRINITY_DN47270_c0_g1_i1.p1 TRINITY_DN47270_c0_g1~~TRINITY_DN47270_c0_g1_i1.p1  ORF type:complete len:105 (+),score=12.47 TRINITY_DN47270_c0_g1_i1:305-619(+)